LPVEVLSILPWQVRGAVADEFCRGQVFLAGDAAHVIPPVGAFGMNTGIADAHNLAWKLGHVVAGHAGPSLLETYETERLPVARTVLDQSLLRLADPSLHWQTGPEGRRRRAATGALNAPVIHLGYRYDSAAVLDASPSLASTEDVEQDLDAAPGSRLPHRWLSRDGERISTLDLVDYRFTLLAGPKGGRWLEAFMQVVERLGVPAAGHQLGDQLTDSAETARDMLGIEDSGAVLVRPDGFVAWRARTMGDGQLTQVLEQTLSALLALPRAGA
jgi:hypothetical protein